MLAGMVNTSSHHNWPSCLVPPITTFFPELISCSQFFLPSLTRCASDEPIRLEESQIFFQRNREAIWRGFWAIRSLTRCAHKAFISQEKLFTSGCVSTPLTIMRITACQTRQYCKNLVWSLEIGTTLGFRNGHFHFLRPEASNILT